MIESIGLLSSGGAAVLAERVRILMDAACWEIASFWLRRTLSLLVPAVARCGSSGCGAEMLAAVAAIIEDDEEEVVDDEEEEEDGCTPLVFRTLEKSGRDEWNKSAKGVCGFFSRRSSTRERWRKISWRFLCGHLTIEGLVLLFLVRKLKERSHWTQFVQREDEWYVFLHCLCEMMFCPLPPLGCSLMHLSTKSRIFRMWSSFQEMLSLLAFWEAEDAEEDALGNTIFFAPFSTRCSARTSASSAPSFSPTCIRTARLSSTLPSSIWVLWEETVELELGFALEAGVSIGGKIIPVGAGVEIIAGMMIFSWLWFCSCCSFCSCCWGWCCCCCCCCWTSLPSDDATTLVEFDELWWETLEDAGKGSKFATEVITEGTKLLLLLLLLKLLLLLLLLLFNWCCWTIWVWFDGCCCCCCCCCWNWFLVCLWDSIFRFLED